MIGRVRWTTTAVLLLLALPWLVPVALGQQVDAGCPVDDADIVIDPGHGGDDPGAQQETYALDEAALNLEIAERVAELLRDEHLLAVALTRTDNGTTLGNSERGDIANACGADLFVMIHLNAAFDPEQDYTVTLWGEKTKDLAFSQVMLRSLASLGIPMADSWQFDNGALLRARMPSVLVEGAFMTNEAEAMDLANGVRQQWIAQAVVQGVVDWLELTGERAR
ncbi:MAG TPA: N-acetylmuramoyl-L-alanine amidase [Thermomicrobiales bacterium]|nr:N-acetylmuramoyl-L-alanine amidase [Thermomicrobiales bacterium]